MRKRHAHAVRAHGPHGKLGVHGAGGRPGKDAQLGDLIENAAAHAFGAMALKRMRDLMGHHRGQPVFVLRVFQDTRKNRNLSSGKARH